jgi:RNA-binding motif protein, X-linked 2
MNTIREIQKINEEELKLGIAGTNASWHEKYANSPWIYIGNLDVSLTEGDVICVLSQYGEIEDLNMIRDQDTGISKGYAFCKYEDTRSCILAVDNLIGMKICQRSIRIDHVEHYRLPKHILEQNEKNEDSGTDRQQQPQNEHGNESSLRVRTAPGHAYVGKELANQFTIEHGIDLFALPVQQQQQQQQQRQQIMVDRNIELETSDKKSERKKRERTKKEYKKEKKHHHKKKSTRRDSSSKKKSKKETKQEKHVKEKRRRIGSNDSDSYSDNESEITTTRS